MQSDRHERISERAYQIWVAEGRVHGRNEEHWRRAERDVAEEERRVAAALADRAVATTETTATRARRRPQAGSPSPKAAGGKVPATRDAPARRRAPTKPSSP